MTDNNMTDNNIHDEMYRQKYLKYKAKYLELRDQEGAGKKNNKDDEIRFKNCAILKLSIRKKTDNRGFRVFLQLVYSGELSERSKKKEPNRKYYISHSDALQQNIRMTELGWYSDKIKKTIELINNASDINTYVLCTHNTRIRCFVNQFFREYPKPDPDTVSGTVSDIEITDTETMFGIRECISHPISLLGLPRTDLHNTDIYIIRHGEAEHNPRSGISKRFHQAFGNYDTELIKEGETQATNAGPKFVNLLGETKINNVFASKLRRTRDTLVHILNKIKLEQLPLEQEKIKMIILPCVHELTKFDKKGDKSDKTGVKSDKKGENCDKFNKGAIIPNENRSKCVYDDQKIKLFKSKDNKSKDNKITSLQSQTICKGDGTNYVNDWSYFNKNNDCTETNFVQLILDYSKFLP
jgi:phosphohistidine phosphatase SixA